MNRINQLMQAIDAAEDAADNALAELTAAEDRAEAAIDQLKADPLSQRYREALDNALAALDNAKDAETAAADDERDARLALKEETARTVTTEDLDRLIRAAEMLADRVFDDLDTKRARADFETAAATCRQKMINAAKAEAQINAAMMQADARTINE